MPRVKYVGNASMWRTAAFGGVAVHAGEIIEVDDDVADGLVENYDFEPADQNDAATEAYDRQPSEPEDNSGEDASPDTTNTAESTDDGDDADDTAGAESEAGDEFDILHESVTDLEDALDTGQFDGQLDALERAERHGDNRSTALEAIDERRNAIDE